MIFYVIYHMHKNIPISTPTDKIIQKITENSSLQSTPKLNPGPELQFGPEYPYKHIHFPFEQTPPFSQNPGQDVSMLFVIIKSEHYLLVPYGVFQIHSRIHLSHSTELLKVNYLYSTVVPYLPQGNDPSGLTSVDKSGLITLKLPSSLGLLPKFNLT